MISCLSFRTKTLFSQLEPKKFWEQLLFLDEQNYGGIQIQEATLLEDDLGNATSTGKADAQDGHGRERKRGEEESSGEDSHSDDNKSDAESDREDTEGLQDSDEDGEEDGVEGGGGGWRLRRLKGQRSRKHNKEQEVRR